MTKNKKQSPPIHRNTKFHILFVGDPNIGIQGLGIIKKYFKYITCIIWDKGDLERKKEIRKLIHSRNWSICISFYNDLIFSAEDLSQMRLALNIHPAFPSLPGLGYDTLPLIEGHQKFGATLHFMIEEIDAGRIIDVLVGELPKQITYSQLRRLTQNLCLEMLEKTAEYISGSNDLLEIEHKFNEMGKRHNYKWDSKYISRQKLKNILEQTSIDLPIPNR